MPLIRLRSLLFTALLALPLLPIACAGGASSRRSEPAGAPPAPRLEAPIVIGHRGASGYLPEHTLAAYERAIDQGADFVEPDLVATRDGVLICRHENELSTTTDVASRFPERRTRKMIDGRPLEGFFSEDFTLAEIKQLRAIQARAFRSQAWNGVYEIPTLEELITLVRRKERETGRTIGLYPETKHPTWFAGLGLSLEEPLVRLLHANGYTGPEAPIFIQSFEIDNLKKLRGMTQLPLVQLLEAADQRPFDQVAKGAPRTYGDMMTPAGLAEIATYARGIGPWKRSIVGEGPDGRLTAPTRLVDDAHRAGLLVHPYTFRDEPQYLAKDYGLEAEAEYRHFFALGVDGVFSDFPDSALRARKGWRKTHDPPR